MKNYKRLITTRQSLFWSTSLFLFYSCASISAPDGGPEDKTPPQFIAVTPEAGSLYFKGGTVRIKFSEYIDEKSLAQAVTVSPNVDPPIEVIYDDDTIELIFPENLLEDQTYVVTLNRNLRDERKVSLDQSIQVAFSTGGVIDDGVISGKVFGRENYAVHLWKLKDVFSDTIFFTEPLYISEANDEGNFEFKYLGPGQYVLLALDRSASGAKLVTERMDYGISPDSIYHININETISNIPLRTVREVPSLKITHGEWVSQKWGWIYFNRGFDSIQMDEIMITDASNRSFYPSVSHDHEDPKRFLMMTEDTLAKGKAELTMGKITIEDHQLIMGKISFRVPAKRDTSFTKKISPEGTETIRRLLDGGPTVPIQFSKPIISVTDSAFIMVADSDTVAVSLDWANPISGYFKPPEGWKEKTQYKLMIFSNGIKPIEGRSLKDSIHWVTIRSEKKMGYGSLTGQYESSGILPVIKIESLEKESEIFHSSVNSNHQFKFNNIPEGPYRLMVIDDKDSSGAFTYGQAKPFKTSEWFFVHPDTFYVRSNWDIDIGSIKVGED